ncbi:MAG: ISNCY family transposase, partial [Candidatus Zixiibacteriota bacterium]
AKRYSLISYPMDNHSRTTGYEEETDLRRRTSNQTQIEFQANALPETIEYYSRYELIDEALRDNPDLVGLVHHDIRKALECANKAENGRSSRYSSEQVLRIAIAQIIEGESLRDISVRVDESSFLRRFTRIFNDKMMSFSTFCALRNAIKPETWHAMNERLARYAVEKGLIFGERLRVDTTAVETNIHWPSDSSLLWDSYRKCAALVRLAREIRPDIDDGRRLQDRRAKRLAQKIARKAAKKSTPKEGLQANAVKTLYSELISMVSDLLALVVEVRGKLLGGKPRGAAKDLKVIATPTALALTMDHYHDLGQQVVSQATRRVLAGEKVPNDQKIFSIFEPHTELIIRGKAGKPIEFGHMVLLQQVQGCFITDYRVFDRRPDESKLVGSVMSSHERLFGAPPDVLTGDKGFYGGMDVIHQLEQRVGVVAICKKGRRTEEETARESTREFKLAQAFRAGIEGSISVLKRCFSLFRCFRKGWKHFVSFVGNAIFAHNLCVLARC